MESKWITPENTLLVMKKWEEGLGVRAIVAETGISKHAVPRILRPLTQHETVHHINGDRLDNRLENLQVRQGRHGIGSVMVCGDCGSHNVVPAPIAEPIEVRHG